MYLLTLFVCHRVSKSCKNNFRRNCSVIARRYKLLELLFIIILNKNDHYSNINLSKSKICTSQSCCVKSSKDGTLGASGSNRDSEFFRIVLFLVSSSFLCFSWCCCCSIFFLANRQFRSVLGWSRGTKGLVAGSFRVPYQIK